MIKSEVKTTCSYCGVGCGIIVKKDSKKFYIVIHTNITMVLSQSIPNLFENAFSYPQLDTILMVEKFIEENSAQYKKKALWQSLPKKMRYQTFNVVINYLIYSNKVGIDYSKKG